MPRVIHIRTTRAKLKEVLRYLPGVLSGRISIATEESRQFALKLGMTTMSLCRQNFTDKSKHGGGADGKPWAPLHPMTIVKRLSKSGRRVKSLPAKIQRLTQDIERGVREWKRIHQHHPGMSQTTLERKLEYWRDQIEKASESLYVHIQSIRILYDTGRLFASFSPGLEGTIRPDGELDVRPGRCICGTNLTYPEYRDHHQGEPPDYTGDRQDWPTPEQIIEGWDKKDDTWQPGRVPQRRFWPKVEDWPESWWKKIDRTAVVGAMEVLEALLDRLPGLRTVGGFQ
jgi:hypothetical protein